jgi:formylglycine-generating enzyme required for sulfatase activity
VSVPVFGLICAVRYSFLKTLLHDLSLSLMGRFTKLVLAAGCTYGCCLLTTLAAVPSDNEPGRMAMPKSYIETVPGSDVKFEMVAIPGGTFQMGSPETEAGRGQDEGPVHPVAIQPFWMGKCEVTWDEYDVYWKQEPHGDKDIQRATEKKGNQKELDAVSRPTDPYSDETFGHGREKHPVLGITHHAAMDYCRWLSQKTGKIYRLPTEAEWEYAARAGTKTAYFFGDSPKALGDYAWYEANSEELTHEVGTKKPNPWGLYDMYGNVAEWCLDHYARDFYATCPLDKTSPEPVSMPVALRFPDVTRGGSWADKASRLRSAARRPSDKSWIKRDPQRPQSIWWLTDGDFVGFRLMRPVAEVASLKGLHPVVRWGSR